MSSISGEKFELTDKTGISAMMSRAEEIREERKKKRESEGKVNIINS